MTDCLNFGNPEKPEIYYQLEEAMKGMSAACEALGAPVVSGNVSLYNESDGVAIYPTPVVGALGVIEDVATAVHLGSVAPSGAVLPLRRRDQPARATSTAYCLTGTPGDLAGSEFFRHAHGLVAGRPDIDLGLEARSRPSSSMAPP